MDRSSGRNRRLAKRDAAIARRYTPMAQNLETMPVSPFPREV